MSDKRPSAKKEEKQVSTGEKKKQMKEPMKKTEKRLMLPPLHSGKPGMTKNAEEVECEKEWYMSKTAMSRHQNTDTEYDGGVLPTVLGCMNRKRMEEKSKDPDENVNNPENTVDIFPTKINIAQACNGDGSAQSAAACLATAKAAVRAKIAALDAVKAAKEGDIEGATEALRNAAMGKSGRAGKSVV